MWNDKLEIMKVIRGTMLRYAITSIALLAAFITALTLVYALPNASIQQNILDSIPDMRHEGWRYRMFDSHQSTLDGYTDQAIAEMQFIADPANPFRAAIVNYGGDNDPYDFLGNIERVAGGGEKTTENYARFWHGYSVWLRPMLLFLNYTQTRIAMNVIFYALVLLVGMLLHIRSGSIGGNVAFATALISAYFLTIPMNWQYFSVFLVALGASAYILAKLKTAAFMPKLPQIMFITGALTCFGNLLSFPLLACGFPLLLALFVIYRRSYIDSDQEFIWLWAKMIVAWSFGYAIFWVSKWIVADLFFGLGTINSAIQQTFFRTLGDEAFQFGQLWWRMPYYAFRYTFGSFTTPAFVVLIAMAGFVLWFVVRYRERKALAFLLTSLMPVVWYPVFLNHSTIHLYMTFRLISISVFAISAAFVCTAIRCLEGE